MNRPIKLSFLLNRQSSRHGIVFLRRTQAVVLAWLLLFAVPAWAAYQYYYSDLFTSIDLTKWTQNGCCTPTTFQIGSGGGLALSAYQPWGGSLISTLAIPDGTSDYEVKMSASFNTGGGAYIIYMRATNDALSIENWPTGTYYSVERIRFFVGSRRDGTLLRTGTGVRRASDKEFVGL
ncbi:MAG: hypothetical protein L0387_05140, partial [Acidobacteria bacterium]|nr:hypothetical protein [Acidobacteriota bacterium]MCI0724101.1 hypothetical protein [Acidobacteriota bacterium]